MNKIFFLSAILLSLGCIKDSQSFTEIIIKNNTSHLVTLTPYYNGNIDSSRLKNISANQELSIEQTTRKGKISEPIVFWDYFKNVDSLVVYWDNLYHCTHMLSDTFFSNNKFIQFGELRNIGDDISYISEKYSDTKKSSSWRLVYTLTEQDYLYAKN